VKVPWCELLAGLKVRSTDRDSSTRARFARTSLRMTMHEWRGLWNARQINVIYSYRNASAGKVLPAAHEGYSVATNETPIATNATKTPSIRRGAKGT
jgi:hypothetical protein